MLARPEHRSSGGGRLLCPGGSVCWAVWLVLLAGGCQGGTRSAPAGACPAAPGACAAVPAQDRDAQELWLLGRLGELRRRLDDPARSADPETQRIIDELNDRYVDWESFLVRVVDARDFPEQAIHNHLVHPWGHYLSPRRLAALACTGEPPRARGLADGGVPDSAFFTRVILESYTPKRIAQEVEDIRPRGPITVTRPKKGGTSEGFFGKDERGVDYIFIFDPPFNPELNTAAEFIGSTLARMAGYRVPKTAICRIEGTGDARYDGRRAVATQAVKGYQGGWTYRAFAHRREVRGLHVLQAWLHNVDATDQNTGLSRQKNGVYLYYVWDFGASLGSFTYRPKSARMGWTYLFEFRELAARCLRPLGLCRHPWEEPYEQYSAAVGYFPDCFDPEQWRPFYPNFAFADATREDKRWAAGLVARFTDEQIHAVVNLAQYTHATDAAEVARVLIARRECIRRTYLPHPAPGASGSED